MLIDNIEYVYSNGSIENTAHNGSNSDIIIAAPHAATQEFDGVNPSDVVVYELDTPTVSDLMTSVTLAERASESLASLFTASNPLRSQTITEWQVYDTDANDLITVGGVVQSADHSAAHAATVTSLSSAALLAGVVAGTDTIEIRAFNGSYWGDWQSLTASVTATPAPRAPTINAQTANQTWTQGEKVALALPANTFTDPQSETLTYTASQSSGQALPSWLSFNATTRTFSGTVPTGMESLTLKVTSTDTSGLSTSETFGVTVPAATPTVTDQTPSQAWTQGQKISLALPAKTFTDPQGQTLTYTARQSNGQALPTWLGFNALTDTFSGTVPAGIESLTLKVTATDTSGLSASESFGVTIPAAAPTVTDQTANQTWTQEQKISLVLPGNTFTDPQNEKLTYAASQSNGQALPAWLSFNAATLTFSGTAPASVESLTLKVSATDTSHLSGSETFGVAVPASGISHGVGAITISASNSVIDPGVGSYKMQFLSGIRNDTVVLHAGGSDEISGFNIGAGDVLDLRTLIGEMHLNLATVAAKIGSYVTVFDQGANAQLLFDPSGNHGGSVVAMLDGLGSTITKLADLTNHGALKFA